MKIKLQKNFKKSSSYGVRCSTDNVFLRIAQVSALLVVLILNSCAVASFSSKMNSPDERAFNRIMPVFIGDKLDLAQLDEAFYSESFEGKFNSFRDSDLRIRLEEAMVRNLQGERVIVVQSSKIFPSNTKVDYQSFLDRLDHYGVDGILVVNLDDYWRSSDDYYDSDTGFFFNGEDPNAKFYCYMVDRTSLKPVWMAQSEVNGVIGSDRVLILKLASKISKGLRKDGLIASQ